ncbi:MAG: site-specific DNA-methyltransferase, partial [Caldilineaceae bacterium]|nr:site-specific DNA-methyltransferase [Caldilineaceae bacterium]
MARTPKNVETLKHDDARRTNIPTAEHQSVMAEEEKSPIRIAYERRNRDLDPQLVWRGKDEQDWSDLVVAAPPLYIQEKVHPKVLIDDLLRQSAQRAADSQSPQAEQLDLFADFNGMPENATATEFYQHDANWTNRMILGDSLQVMASLAEREGLRGKVQCIYIDPPYGIKFNSNFQWSTTSRNVKDGYAGHITREPEQVKAFRDTWRDGIHSYLTYLRDRLTVVRDLLSDSGSIFFQIGDENVHLVRSLLDEVFGSENFCRKIVFSKTSGQTDSLLASTNDFIIWYAKDRDKVKYRQLFIEKAAGDTGSGNYRFVELPDGSRRSMSKEEFTLPRSVGQHVKIYRLSGTSSQTGGKDRPPVFEYRGRGFTPEGTRGWSTTITGLQRAAYSNRLVGVGNTLTYVRYLNDFPVQPLTDLWLDTGISGFGDKKTYVVQTTGDVIARCILMTTDPGDLVLDPTCGSGTSAYVAEQWGRRWITIDTSRVALALARARLMGARYPYYLLADSAAGQLKEAEVSHTAPSTSPSYGNIRHGFVYERAPHIMLKHIANNAEIDVIWEQFQEVMEPLCAQLNAELSQSWEEWDIPRKAKKDWSAKAKELHAAWWKERIARQTEMDASIAANSDQEFLYDKPYEERNTVRVAGPFTVESLSPHRVLVVDENDELQPLNGKFIQEKPEPYGSEIDFTQLILDNLKTAGVQQAHKEGRITFTALSGWPGHYLCAEGRYLEGESAKERRAGIFIGPEFGTVQRADLVAAAREAGDAGFDVLIACAFNYDAHSAEFEKLGRIPVLKARMNADLHMADALKNTGAGNLFVIFGEPDIDIEPVGDDQIRVKINGVDVFHPQSGTVQSGGPDDIAVWFIDTDYNEESFFVRHAYFLGANDPYSSLKTTLKA